MLSKPEIHKLIRLAKNGDDIAFGEIMNNYKMSVFYMIQRIVKDKYDAEDLCSEVFSKVYFNLDMYIENYSFSTWLFKIASNKAIDFVRKQKREKTIKINQSVNTQHDLYVDLSSNEPNPETLLENKQKEEVMKKYIKLLPEEVRIVMEMRVFEGLSYKEISEKYAITMSTVKSRIYRGRNLLTRMMRYDNNKENYKLNNE